MIKALFLDMGGVLRRLDMEGVWTAFLELGWDDVKEYVHPTHQRHFIGDFESGKIGIDEFLTLCCSHCKPGTTHEQAAEAFMRIFKGGMDYAVAELLQELSGRYKLYLTSNNNPIAMGHFERDCRGLGLEPSSVFADYYLSYTLKIMKPSREYFLEAVRRSGFEPAEILFVDDSASNVEGGAAVGLNTLLFVPGSDLRACLSAKLQELG